MKLKKVLGIGVGVAMAVGFALPAMAATFSNVQFDNGDVTISGTGGSTVNATFHVLVPANQVVERIQTDVISDNLAPVCTEVGGEHGLEEGTHDVTLPIKLPPNTGTFTLAVQGSGIFGGFKTVDCANDVVGSASFSSALRVVSSDSNASTGGSTGTQSAMDKLTAMIASLIASLKPASGTPNSSAACTAYLQANTGTQANVYSDANVRLQGFLLSQGMQIPALKAGASFGFYGNQTTAAVGMFNSINHCS